ncbi:MAG: helix-turn-helix domain-containing protein [Pseudonocardiaceae bacterium]
MRGTAPARSGGIVAAARRLFAERGFDATTTRENRHRRRQVPLQILLLGIGRAFLGAVDEQLDLIKILISQRHLLTTDTRFVEFIDTAATGLGTVIDWRHPPAGDSIGS